MILVGFNGWKLNEIISQHESDAGLITLHKAAADRAKIAIREFSAEHKSRFNRERMKNQQMEEQLASILLEKSVLSETYEKKEASFHTLTSINEEQKEQLSKLRIDLESFDKNLNLHREKASQVSQVIPFIERNIVKLQNQADLQKEIAGEVSHALKDYAGVTQVLKQHFARTLDSIYEDKYDRPWIEKGEFIELSNFSVNLDDGLLGLPVGREIGIVENALFSIHFSGELICNVRIKKSTQNNSIGVIMPLIGNPHKLLEINRFDLTHL